MLGDPCRPQAQGDRCDRRSVRPLHPAWRSCSHPLRQRTGVRGQGRAGMDRGGRRQDRLHRAGQSLGERLHRELQRAPSRRAARRRNLLLAPRGPNCHRELAAPLQHDQAARLTWIQATSTGGVRARLRRVAGCATPSGSAGHAGETANFKLTFHLDHSAGADQNEENWSGALFSQTELLRTCWTLQRGDLRLPGSARAIKVPMCRLDALGGLGYDRRDIHDAFEVSTDDWSPYPAFWSHESDKVRSIGQKPSANLLARTVAAKGRKLKRASDVWSRAGTILLAERLR